MIASPLPSLALQCATGALVGAALGYAYFRALWWNVTLFDKGATAAGLLLLATRFILLASAFYMLARFGAATLISAALGLLAARRVLVRRLGGAP